MKNLKTAWIKRSKANGSLTSEMYLLENQKDVLKFMKEFPEQNVGGLKKLYQKYIYDHTKIVIHMNRNLAGFFSWCIVGKEDFQIVSKKRTEQEQENINDKVKNIVS